MEVLPAIDLLDGNAVRLHQGRYDHVTIYDRDPASVAARWRGVATRLHVVDLEGARAGRTVQRELVKRIVAAFGAGVEVGGGIRSLDAAAEVLDLGAERVVLGTAAIQDPAMVREAAARWPDRVVVALDAKDGNVAVKGWESVSDRTALDVAHELAGARIGAILYTDISRDGTRAGPNFAATEALARGGGHAVIASGGVGTLDDLTALGKIPGVVGAIVGRALYDGVFTVQEAITAALGR